MSQLDCSLYKCVQVKCPLDIKENWRTRETFNSKIRRNIFKRQWCQNEKNQTKTKKTKSKWTNNELKGLATRTETQPSLIRAWSGPEASGQSDTSRADLSGGLGEENFPATHLPQWPAWRVVQQATPSLSRALLPPSRHQETGGCLHTARGMPAPSLSLAKTGLV